MSSKWRLRFYTKTLYEFLLSPFVPLALPISTFVSSLKKHLVTSTDMLLALRAVTWRAAVSYVTTRLLAKASL